MPLLKVFIPILLDVNLSLNQTLLTFLLYERQTWITQLSLEIIIYVFSWLYFMQCFLLLFHYQTPSSSLCMVFDAISTNIGDILPINLSTKVFAFGEFIVHQKDWLTYSRRTISNKLPQIVNFPTQTLDFDSHRPAFLCLFSSWHYLLL